MFFDSTPTSRAFSNMYIEIGILKRVPHPHAIENVHYELNRPRHPNNITKHQLACNSITITKSQSTSPSTHHHHQPHMQLKTND